MCEIPAHHQIPCLNLCHSSTMIGYLSEGSILNRLVHTSWDEMEPRCQDMVSWSMQGMGWRWGVVWEKSELVHARYGVEMRSGRGGRVSWSMPGMGWRWGVVREKSELVHARYGVEMRSGLGKEWVGPCKVWGGGEEWSGGGRGSMQGMGWRWGVFREKGELVHARYGVEMRSGLREG